MNCLLIYEKIAYLFNHFYHYGLLDGLLGYTSRVEKGTNNPYSIPYSSTRTYERGDLVSYQDNIYICLTQSLNNLPTTSSFRLFEQFNYSIQPKLSKGYFNYSTGVLTDLVDIPVDAKIIENRYIDDDINNYDPLNTYVVFYYTGTANNVIII